MRFLCAIRLSLPLSELAVGRRVERQEAHLVRPGALILDRTRGGSEKEPLRPVRDGAARGVSHREGEILLHEAYV